MVSFLWLCWGFWWFFGVVVLLVLGRLGDLRFLWWFCLILEVSFWLVCIFGSIFVCVWVVDNRFWFWFFFLLFVCEFGYVYYLEFEWCIDFRCGLDVVVFWEWLWIFLSWIFWLGCCIGECFFGGLFFSLVVFWVYFLGWLFVLCWDGCWC